MGMGAACGLVPIALLPQPPALLPTPCAFRMPIIGPTAPPIPPAAAMPGAPCAPGPEGPQPIAGGGGGTPYDRQFPCGPLCPGRYSSSAWPPRPPACIVCGPPFSP
eukprot:3140995-Pleurochrysis_carterae.AAC.2